MAITKNEILDIFSDLRFSFFGIDFEFFLQEKGDGFLIQVGAELPCNISGQPELMKSGKVYVSSHGSKSEVVFKCWQVCQSFLEHEARESFFYKNVMVFHPHQDIEQLKAYVQSTELVVRS